MKKKYRDLYHMLFYMYRMADALIYPPALLYKEFEELSKQNLIMSDDRRIYYERPSIFKVLKCEQ